jgi:hypothetical protein
MNRGRLCWKAFGVPYRRERQQESGQLLIDKEKCWEPLKLCNWYNERSDFYYKVVYGDKDTFRFAWHRLRRPFAFSTKSVKANGVHYQYDLHGRLIFQHRFRPKWSLGDNPGIAGFIGEDECRGCIDELRSKWSPAQFLLKRVLPESRRQMRELAGAQYRVSADGFDDLALTLEEDGAIGAGRAGAAYFWRIEDRELVVSGADGRTTLRLVRGENGGWLGCGERAPHVRVQLLPRKTIS